MSIQFPARPLATRLPNGSPSNLAQRPQIDTAAEELERQSMSEGLIRNGRVTMERLHDLHPPLTPPTPLRTSSVLATAAVLSPSLPNHLRRVDKPGATPLTPSRIPIRKLRKTAIPRRDFDGSREEDLVRDSAGKDDSIDLSVVDVSLLADTSMPLLSEPEASLILDVSMHLDTMASMADLRVNTKATETGGTWMMEEL